VIHAIYLQRVPKGLWTLVSVSESAETALKDKRMSLEAAKKSGKDQAKTAIRTFETTWFLPETLAEVEENERLLYN